MKSQSGFQQLDGKLQSFILQIGAGYTKLEDLVESEASATKEHITMESQRAERALKEYISEKERSRQSLETLMKQRERLLQSLSFPEMNMRRNEIMGPEDAHFERVFRSYEKRANLADETGPSNDHTEHAADIDGVWSSFVLWLQSDEPLFWIQGKPGSGKSTLVKHITFHESTQELLNVWNGNTRIISHYFYMIGTPLQSNLTGFYLSLLHQLLSADASLLPKYTLVHEIIEQLPSSSSKQYLGDWAISELKKALNTALERRVETQPLCIFVDGLDEYTGEDGQNGLLDILQTIGQYSKVKICVSSRPEPRLRDRLDQRPNLKLHDLTWPDMKTYISEELAEFVGKGSISHEVSGVLTEELLNKAEGVFLWLRLALRSVKDGIRNKDQEELLMSRLRDLPPKLEDLYEAMWKKINRDTTVYRRSAARYLHLAINGKNVADAYAPYRDFSGPEKFTLRLSLPGVSLFEIMCTNEKRAQAKLLDLATEPRFEDFNALCEEVGNEILVQCAGLLEIRPYGDLLKYINCGKMTERSHQIRASHKRLESMTKRVSFVHRTARDFLTSTSAGKSILSHSKDSPADMLVSLSKSFLCRTRLFRQEYDLAVNFPAFLEHIQSMWIKLAASQRMDDLSEVLGTTKHLYESGCFLFLTAPAAAPHFLSCLVSFTEFDAFALQNLENIGPDTATHILTELWTYAEPPRLSPTPSIEVVRKLLSEGANPFAVQVVKSLGYEQLFSYVPVKRNAVRGIITRLDRLLGDSAKEEFHAVEVVASMLEAWPRFINHRWLVAPRLWEADGVCRLILNLDFLFERSFGTGAAAAPVFEVSTSYLLKHALDRTKNVPMATELGLKLDEMHNELASSRPLLRFVEFEAGYVDGHCSHPYISKPVTFRVQDQKPLEAVLSLFFDLEGRGGIREYLTPEAEAAFREWRTVARSLTENSDVLQIVERQGMWAEAAYLDDGDGTYTATSLPL